MGVLSFLIPFAIVILAFGSLFGLMGMQKLQEETGHEFGCFGFAVMIVLGLVFFFALLMSGI